LLTERGRHTVHKRLTYYSGFIADISNQNCPKICAYCPPAKLQTTKYNDNNNALAYSAGCWANSRWLLAQYVIRPWPMTSLPRRGFWVTGAAH